MSRFGGSVRIFMYCYVGWLFAKLMNCIFSIATMIDCRDTFSKNYQGLWEHLITTLLNFVILPLQVNSFALLYHSTPRYVHLLSSIFHMFYFYFFSILHFGLFLIQFFFEKVYFYQNMAGNTSFTISMNPK